MSNAFSSFWVRIFCELSISAFDDYNDPSTKDTVDNLPSFEHYIYHHAHGDMKSHPRETEKLRVLTKPIVETRLLPYLQQRYKCAACRVCTSLVRRYLPGERLSHPPHFDSEAFITVVIALTARGRHFLGGLHLVRANTSPTGALAVPLFTKPRFSQRLTEIF